MKEPIPRLFGVAGITIVFYSLALTCYRFTFAFTVSYFEKVLHDTFQLLSGTGALISLTFGLVACVGKDRNERLGIAVMVLSAIALLLSFFCVGASAVYDRGPRYEAWREIIRQKNSQTSP